MCSSVLQCVAVCCSALQCVVVCSSVLQCVAVCCMVVYCVAVCCSMRRVLQCVALCRSMLQYVVACCNVLQRVRPTQSIIRVTLLVNRFQKSILLIVQYKYLKFCSRDLNLQNMILRTRSCSNGFITQSSWIFQFHPTIMVRWKCFVPQFYQFRRGIWGGASPYFFLHES